MLKKVKTWLGIEGVKLELDLPEVAYENIGMISGKVQFLSMNYQTVRSVKLVLIERYARGRGTERLVDEYQLGQMVLDHPIDIPANETVSIDFDLPFKIVRSDIDEMGQKNVLLGGIAKLARKLQSVSSDYYLMAEADVQGTALNPFDKKEIRIE